MRGDRKRERETDGKSERATDEDWIALLREFGLHDKADVLAADCVASSMSLFQTSEGEAEQLRTTNWTSASADCGRKCRTIIPRQIKDPL